MIIRYDSLVLSFGTGLILLIGFSGCLVQPDLGFVKIPEDEIVESIPSPPTLEELHAQKSYIAFLPVQYAPGLTRYHRTLSHAFVLSVLEEYGNLEVIDNSRVKGALNRTEFRKLKQVIAEEQFRRYEKPLIDGAIQLGKQLGVRYIGLMRVQTSPVKVSANDWSTYISFRIYRVEDPSRIEMNYEFAFVFSESNSLWEDLGIQVRGRFPLSGFILETRGNREYVRLNLGRANRISVEQECKVFRRIRKIQQQAGNRKKETTEFDLLGKLVVVNVQQDFAWGKIKPEFRGKISKGDAIRCY